MSSFDPNSFEDLSALASFRQRNEQLKMAHAQARELARLNESVQEEAGRRNLLYSLKKASEQINLMLNTGSYENAYALMTQAKNSFFTNNLKQEDFSTLEFKNLADDLSSFYAKIDSYLVGVVPPEIMGEIKKKEQLLLREEEARQAALQAERTSALKRSYPTRGQNNSEKAFSQAKVIITAVFLVFILYLLFLGVR